VREETDNGLVVGLERMSGFGGIWNKWWCWWRLCWRWWTRVM